MKKIIKPKRKEWDSFLQRPVNAIESIETTVNSIFDDIKRNGNADVLRYTSIFDGVMLDDLFVSEAEIKEAEQLVPDELKTAIKAAKENIYKFHKAQQTETITVAITEGVTCWQEKRPIQNVGLYIPGGTAPLFSTVLMLAIPAKIAGCKEIILVSPPNKNGKLHPATIYSAYLCGVTKIAKIGGIQAIAALTFGTETISKVDKIFGPGNQFVTTAKQLATKYGVAIDMPAGPSELLIMADASANVDFIASDLLSQAEHGTDSQVLLVSTDLDLLDKVSSAVYEQMKEIPRREIAAKAIENSKLIYVENKETAIDLINLYGPEHFMVSTSCNEYYVENIQNAGSVFIGDYSPESAGDYASGTNHTLPTNGYTKSYSGINLDAFLKAISFQEITKEGLKKIGNVIEILAAAEGLDAHKNAVSVRLKEFK